MGVCRVCKCLYHGAQKRWIILRMYYFRCERRCFSTTMATIKEIGDYIISVYSRYGVELHSIGDDSLVVNLPPKFRDISEFCITLNEEFGCIVDIEYDTTTLKAVVWLHPLEKKTVLTEQIQSHQENNTAFFGTRILFVLCIIMLLCSIFIASRPDVSVKPLIKRALLQSAEFFH